jgi:uncharacterized membrane protein (UPF0182 family)
MLLYNLLAFLVLVVVSLGIALLIYRLLRGDLRDLLSPALKIPGGTSFFLRALLIVLLFSALAGSIGKEFSLKAEARFIEYVWSINSGLKDVFQNSLLSLLGYLVLITVLVATLKPKNE